MKPADICIALLVVLIWGLAFVASEFALVIAGLAIMVLGSRRPVAVKVA